MRAVLEGSLGLKTSCTDLSLLFITSPLSEHALVDAALVKDAGSRSTRRDGGVAHGYFGVGRYNCR